MAHLKTQANSQNRFFVSSAVLRSNDLPLDSPDPEPSRANDPISALQFRPILVVLGPLLVVCGFDEVARLHPEQIEVVPHGDGGVFEGFDDGEVGVLEGGVFADEGNFHGFGEFVNGGGKILPLGDVGGGNGEVDF